LPTNWEKIQIIKLLRELKKDRNWLAQFLIYNNPAPKVDLSLPISQLLERLPDTLLAKLLSELNGIKRSYENNGFPRDFDSVPVPDIPATLVEIERNQSLLESLNLTALESEILVHLLVEGVETASHISQSTGIQRVETYRYLSALMAKGLVRATDDRPQKFYCEPEIALRFYRG
jgi:DNA-binding transcriptional ArsR family regulator